MEIYFLKRIISVEVNEARGISHYKSKRYVWWLDDDGLFTGMRPSSGAMPLIIENHWTLRWTGKLSGNTWRRVRLRGRQKGGEKTPRL